MYDIRIDPMMVERAYLVGVRTPGTSEKEAREHLEELEELVATLDIPVVGFDTIQVKQLNPALMVGSGKADQIESELRRLDADCLIFDDEILPNQQRNWEKRLKDICVIDRQEIIIDIFAKRARTQEAVWQIQLARLEYSLPRLQRAWTHLERQRNARGVRGGPGEMQIEIDRRLVRDQIASIKRKLKEVDKRKATQRKQRGIRPMPTAAIIGYTNAGKSSLLNLLANAGVLAENKLFATLDPTTRKVGLPNNQEILMTDTVGFIRKLPHDLVESFKATLLEAADADVLVHVVDASHPNASDHIKTTMSVLQELGVENKPTVLALNKIDLLENPSLATEFFHKEFKSIPISVKNNTGIDRLLEAIAEIYPESTELLDLEIPVDRYDLIAIMHREGQILEQKYLEQSVKIRVVLPVRLKHQIDSYLV